MKTYSPSQKTASCTLILRSVLALLCASLQLCEVAHTRCMGVEWVCFILEYMPMVSDTVRYSDLRRGLESELW